MTKLKLLANWVLKSSADPTKYSRTIKGLAKVVPSLVILTKLFGVELSAEGLESTIESVDTGVVAIFLAIGSAETAFGAIRKAYLSIKNIFLAS